MTSDLLQNQSKPENLVQEMTAGEKQIRDQKLLEMTDLRTNIDQTETQIGSKIRLNVVNSS